MQIKNFFEQAIIDKAANHALDNIYSFDCHNSDKNEYLIVDSYRFLTEENFNDVQTYLNSSKDLKIIEYHFSLGLNYKIKIDPFDLSKEKLEKFFVGKTISMPIIKLPYEEGTLFDEKGNQFGFTKGNVSLVRKKYCDTLTLLSNFDFEGEQNKITFNGKFNIVTKKEENGTFFISLNNQMLLSNNPIDKSLIKQESFWKKLFKFKK